MLEHQVSRAETSHRIKGAPTRMHPPSSSSPLRVTLHLSDISTMRFSLSVALAFAAAVFAADLLVVNTP